MEKLGPEVLCSVESLGVGGVGGEPGAVTGAVTVVLTVWRAVQPSGQFVAEFGTERLMLFWAHAVSFTGNVKKGNKRKERACTSRTLFKKMVF